jgi:hypothetical protein
MKLTKHELMRHPWLKGALILQSDSFPFEEHNLDNSFLSDFDGTSIVLPEGWIVLGMIDGNDLKVRPRPGVAVKFSDGEGEFWMHIIHRFNND